MAIVKRMHLDGDKFIKATATGDLDLEESKRALKLLLEDPAVSHMCDILIDLRAAECELTVAEIFGIVQFLVENRLSFLGKMAVLVPGQREFNKAKFMELCAENRGIQVHAFDQVCEAKAWLGVQE
jgi:hypothetical protein